MDDFVECPCKEICVHGGNKNYCGAKDWGNFVRIDDEGNEVEIKVQDKKEPLTSNEKIEEKKPLISLEDKLDALKLMIEDYESLPSHGQYQTVSVADHLSMLLIVESLFCDVQKMLEGHRVSA